MLDYALKNGFDKIATGDLGVHHRNKQQGNCKQCCYQGVPAAEGEAGEQEIIVNADHPNGNGGFVEHLFTPDQGNEDVQNGSAHRQYDVGPHVFTGNGIDTFKHDAAHGGCQRQKGCDPGQRVFAADIKMCSLFHNTVILAK